MTDYRKVRGMLRHRYPFTQLPDDEEGGGGAGARFAGHPIVDHKGIDAKILKSHDATEQDANAEPRLANELKNQLGQHARQQKRANPSPNPLGH